MNKILLDFILNSDNVNITQFIKEKTADVQLLELIIYLYRCGFYTAMYHDDTGLHYGEIFGSEYNAEIFCSLLKTQTDFALDRVFKTASNKHSPMNMCLGMDMCLVINSCMIYNPPDEILFDKTTRPKFIKDNLTIDLLPTLISGNGEIRFDDRDYIMKMFEKHGGYDIYDTEIDTISTGRERIWIPKCCDEYEF